MDPRGKTAIITGGSTGIGMECALLMAEAGCKTYCFNRTDPASRHPNIIPVMADVTKREQILAGLGQVRGPIHILFNNAGVMRRGTLCENTEEEFDLLFDTHVKGSWLMFTLARLHLADDATIVQMSSRHALHPPANPGLYGLSKQTTMHLAELIARTYPQYKVKTVFPGPVDTAVARYGVEGKALEEKIKTMHSARFIAAKIVDLIRDDRQRLVFDPETWDYRME
jgi:NAD(P)-dependent dehydrogenase (short-subunit alcohol dehydrogenase family)